ncbi:MAG: hypothetical protein ACXWCJ_19640, partial [Caldimonas sp.]
KWKRLVQACVDMDDDEYQRHSQGALRYAQKWANPKAIADANYQVFQDASASARGPARSEPEVDAWPGDA